MAYTKNEEAQILRIQEGLKCSRDEALEIFEYDRKVDKATVKERLEHDLAADVEKEALKMTKCLDRKQTVYNFDKRERKANPTKGGIIVELAEFIQKNSQFDTANVEITNKERMIAFSIGDDKFEITLTQKRKPKS